MTIAQICREYLRSQPINLKKLEESADIGKKNGKLLSNFVLGNTSLREENLMKLAKKLLELGMKITPEQSTAEIDIEAKKLIIWYYVGVSDTYIHNKIPKTPKREQVWWLNQDWGQNQ